MTAKQLPIEIVNVLLHDLQYAFYIERGGETIFRCYNVGRAILDYLVANHLLNFDEKDPKELTYRVCNALAKLGVVSGTDVRFEDKLVTIVWKDCVHFEVEKKLEESKVPVVACPWTNTIMSVFETKYRLATERLPIDSKNKTCLAKFVAVKRPV